MSGFETVGSKNSADAARRNHRTDQISSIVSRAARILVHTALRALRELRRFDVLVTIIGPGEVTARGGRMTPRMRLTTSPGLIPVCHCRRIIALTWGETRRESSPT